MGTLVGHVAPGFGFLLIGLWHLFNHIKLHSLNPNTYTSPSWFPAHILRHLELILIMLGSTMSIAMELFIGPDRHQPLDPDWTIPPNHLHNFEHSLISFSFFIYALSAILLDHIRPAVAHGLAQLIAAMAFGQQLFMFHLHSADHMGVEGQYHFLLQIVIVVTFATTLMGIARPRSFLISFVRSLSITFQGVWFMIMGFALWTPRFMPKGCWMNLEDGHLVVRCEGEKSLHRAKSLVNIQFSWSLACMTIFGIAAYLILFRLYKERSDYMCLDQREHDHREKSKNDDDDDDEDEDEDLESQKDQKEKMLEESKSFIHMGKGFTALEMER